MTILGPASLSFTTKTSASEKMWTSQPTVKQRTLCVVAPVHLLPAHHPILTQLNMMLSFPFTQLRILAKDGGTPPLTATTTVQVDVQRNIFPPVFTSNSTEDATIPETLPAGAPVAAVMATDADDAVSGLKILRMYFE